MSLHDYAEREMAIAWPESDPMQDLIKRDILAVIDVFAEQGHSGASAAYTLSALDRLLRFKPIAPLTGADDEWRQPSGGDDTQQNKRCSSVFRRHFDNGTAYDIDGKVFSEDGGKTFYSCRESRIPVTFPYYPKEKPERVILPQEETDLSVEELEQTGTKPRVLMSDELRDLPRLAIVFIECFDGEYQAPLPTIMAGMKCYDGTIVDEDGSTFSDFEDDMKPGRMFDGSYFRFWNMMPTEEQRKAVPWE